MNAIPSNPNPALPAVTIGAIRSHRKGKIILVYLNEDSADASILRYDRLSWQERTFVREVAQDPLSVLGRPKATGAVAREAA